MVERIDARLSAVEVWWWDPFGLAVAVFAGGPALFGEFVVGAAAKGQVVDVGDRVYGVAVAVVDFAEVAGDVAVGKRTPTVFGVEHNSLRWRGQAFGVVERECFAVVEDGQVVMGVRREPDHVAHRQ